MRDVPLSPTPVGPVLLSTTHINVFARELALRPSLFPVVWLSRSSWHAERQAWQRWQVEAQRCVRKQINLDINIYSLRVQI